MEYALDDVELHDGFLRSINEIWTEEGLDQKQRLECSTQLQQKLSRFYHESLQQAGRRRDELKEEIRLLEAQTTQLQDALGVHDSPVTVEKSLRQLKPLVKSRLTSLQQLRDTRLIQLRELSFLVHSLSQLLEIPLSDDFRDIGSSDLTESRIKRFQDKIQELKSEKTQRAVRMQQIVDDISELVSILGEDSDDPSATVSIYSLSCLSSGSQGYSPEIIERLNEKKTSLLQLKERRTQQLNQLKEKITALWDRLSFDEEQRTAFSQKFSQKGVSKALLEECIQEVDRLELLKKQTIQTLIIDRRSKISALWVRLHYGEVTKQEFAEFNQSHSVESEESLLDAHDLYLENLEVQYQQSKLLIKMIARRESLLKQQLELDAKIQDPNRLLGAGRSSVALLSEEASRTAIKKELPKLERSLEDELKQWAVEHDGLPFLYNGFDYLQSIYALRLEEETKQRTKEQARRGLVTPSRADLSSHSTPAKSHAPSKTTPYKAPQPKTLPAQKLVTPQKTLFQKPQTTAPKATAKPLRQVNSSSEPTGTIKKTTQTTREVTTPRPGSTK